MNGDIVDAIGEVLLYCIPVTPFITVPLLWKLSSQKKVVKVLPGLLLALMLSLSLAAISFGIAFRNGMGPG